MDRAAIIFDVDGVLLELTRAEEDLFFEPFKKYNRPELISYDWNSYRVRNEEDIFNELIERHGLPTVDTAKFITKYLALVEEHKLPAVAIAGARELLQKCSTFATLGIATANFRSAARMRLERANLWHFVDQHACGADGGGAKHNILGRALATMNMSKSRIIYIGDNLNDLEAGQHHDLHFIGFSCEHTRLETLGKAGAQHLSQNHDTTLKLIKDILAL
jgi:phosphoglycolate phosphatase-like HAD superfamily hydrolase